MTEAQTKGLTAQEVDKMRHALGIGRGGNRNHYAAGGDDVLVWEGLVAKGLARKHRESPIFPDPIYSVTDDGLSALQQAEA